MSSLLILRRDEAQRLVGPAEAVAAVEAAWRSYGTHRKVLSTPSSMGLSGGGAVFKAKGAILPRDGVAGFRLVADHAEETGRERTEEWFWLADPGTGRPLALVEGFGLHLLRTAATGAVAARLLARPDCRVLGLVGTGRIAAALLAPLRLVLPGLEKVQVAARRPASAETFARQHAAPGLSIEPCATPAEAVAGADLVVTITAAAAAFLRPEHLSPGATVIGLGDTEIEAGVLTQWADRFIVDDLAFALVTGSVAGWVASGALTRDAVAARLDADVGEVALGPPRGRAAPAQNVLAVVQGMAVGDLALAALAWRRAMETGAGASVPLSMEGTRCARQG